MVQGVSRGTDSVLRGDAVNSFEIASDLCGRDVASRGTGKTAALLKMLHGHPTMQVAVHTAAMGRYFESQGIDRSRVIVLGAAGSLNGWNAPVMLDNYTWTWLLESMLTQHEQVLTELARVDHERHKWVMLATQLKLKAKRRRKKKS